MFARTKPITVEAVQWRGDNEGDLIAFFPEGTRFIWRGVDAWIKLPSRQELSLFPNNWAVKIGDEYVWFVDRWVKQLFEQIEAPEENEGSD